MDNRALTRYFQPNQNQQTSFRDLPFEVQSHILSKLPIKDQCNARLVSFQFFQLLKPHFKPNLVLHESNLPAKLEFLQNEPTFTALGTVTVQNLNSPCADQKLGVFSKRRSKLLPCKKLVIGSELHPDSLTRLIRYYLPYSAGPAAKLYSDRIWVLELTRSCFMHLDPLSLKKIGFNCPQIGVFKITMESFNDRMRSNRPQAVSQLRNQIKCLSAVLRIAQFPTLQKCEFHVVDINKLELIRRDAAEESPGLLLELQNAVGKFLLAHSNIRSLKIEAEGLIKEETLEVFNEQLGCLRNLEEFMLVFQQTQEVNGIASVDTELHRIGKGLTQQLAHLASLKICSVNIIVLPPPKPAPPVLESNVVVVPSNLKTNSSSNPAPTLSALVLVRRLPKARVQLKSCDVLLKTKPALSASSVLVLPKARVQLKACDILVTEPSSPPAAPAVQSQPQHHCNSSLSVSVPASQLELASRGTDNDNQDQVQLGNVQVSVWKWFGTIRQKIWKCIT